MEKENSNLTGHLPDLDPNTSEPVEKYSVEKEPENNPCVETEIKLPDTILAGTGRDEQLIEIEQKHLESSNGSSREQTERGEVHTSLPSSSDLTDSSQEASQPIMSNSDHVPAEVADIAVSEQGEVTVRRSERQRKPPGKFTYPQLGNPFISFVQTMFDGFNKAIVETFESNYSFEKSA